MDSRNISMTQLQAYAQQVENFTKRVSRYCDALDSGADYYGKHMSDRESQDLCQKSRQVARDIKACLFPVQRFLEQVQQLSLYLGSAEDFSR